MIMRKFEHSDQEILTVRHVAQGSIVLAVGRSIAVWATKDTLLNVASLMCITK